MELWGTVFGLFLVGTVAWALREGALFVQRVLVRKDDFNENIRKRTKILFPISILSVVVGFIVCFLFSKVSIVVLIFLTYFLLFFGILPYGIAVFPIIALVLFIWRVFIRRDKYDENQRRTSKIYLLVSVFLFGTSIIIRILYVMLFNFMFHK